MEKRRQPPLRELLYSLALKTDLSTKTLLHSTRTAQGLNFITNLQLNSTKTVFLGSKTEQPSTKTLLHSKCYETLHETKIFCQVRTITSADDGMGMGDHQVSMSMQQHLCR